MTSSKGLVSIVGAGPGDPRLLTVKGHTCIRKADVIIYDSLAHPALLAIAAKDCVFLYAGKKYMHKSITQKQLTGLMVAQALTGKRVCRLKGGDPMVFSRISEELDALKKSGIPYEIVPGVTSASGASAYSEILLTDRRKSSSVSFVTAQQKNGRTNYGEIAHLIKSSGTVVVYMGVSMINGLQRALLKYQISEQTPVCAVSSATLGKQQKTFSTIGTMGADLNPKTLHRPAVIIIGANTGNKTPGWFEKKPLFGQRIVITRSIIRNRQFVDLLMDEGAEVAELPTIEIEPPDNCRVLDRSIRHIDSFRWIIFTSPNSVESFFGRLYGYHKSDARVLAGIKIAAVGSSTAAILKYHGIKADLIPAKYSAEHLAGSLDRADGSAVKGKLLLIRSDIALTGINQSLKKSGYQVVQATGYKTTCPKKSIQIKFARLKASGIDAMVFTSSSTVKNFISSVGEKEGVRFLNSISVFSIGPVTSKTLTDYNVHSVIESDIHTLDGIGDAIIQYHED